MLKFLRGKSGEIRSGYQTAAKLGRWSMRWNGACYVLEAEPDEVNGFWIKRKPLSIRLTFGRSEVWRFSDVELLENKESLTLLVKGEREKGGIWDAQTDSSSPKS
jgi:hypothetical protein